MRPKHAPRAYALRRLTPGYEALGLALDFLTREEPFRGYGAGTVTAAVKYQLANASHFAAVEGERLVGYAGWLRIDRRMGKAWMSGHLGELKPVPEKSADAIALTVVRSEDPRLVLDLLRAVRRAEAGKSVFYKRVYARDSGRAKFGVAFADG